MKKIFILIVLVFALFVFIGCSSDTTVYNIPSHLLTDDSRYQLLDRITGEVYFPDHFDKSHDVLIFDRF